MSDRLVLQLLEEMEARLDDPAALDAGALEDWNRRFREAELAAERGPGWAALRTKAQGIGGKVQARVAELRVRSGALKSELEDQARGARALKGYAPPIG
jgi:hypothetical protein